MSEIKIPTEMVELPSKGLLYPEGNPLREGKVEMKYMTAKEEDILTNQNYIRQGVVIDKLLQSLVVTKINYNDLFVGDKNALMIAARILSYGASYEFEYKGVRQNVDLSEINSKSLHSLVQKSTSNSFEFILPNSGNVLNFRLLTHGDEAKIDAEVKGLQKINKEATSEVTARLFHMITAINGSSDTKDIRDFVNNYFLAKDARAFRQFYNEISPDLDMIVSLTTSDGGEEDVDLPVGINFFWPDA